MIDTHCHIDFENFDEIREDIITKSQKLLKYIINIGTNLDTSITSIDLAKKYDFIYASVGVHPYDINLCNTEYLQKIEELISKNNKVIAIGECGIDLSQSKNTKSQEKIFNFFIELSKKYELPLIIHSRDSFDQTYNIIKNNPPKKCVMHCFNYSIKEAEKFLKLNSEYKISFTGILTFPNAHITYNTALNIDIDKIILETDAPFLAPQKYRGKLCMPFYVIDTAQKLAIIKNIDYTKVEEILDNNAINFFNLKKC